MTNSVAVFLIAVIAALLVLDHFWLHIDVVVLTGKWLHRSIDYLIFWN